MLHRRCYFMHIGLKLEVSTQEIYFVAFVNNETVLNISYFYASLVGSLLHSLLQRENSYSSPRSPRLITDGAHVNVISAGGLPRIFSGFPFVFSHIFLYHVLFSFDVLIFFSILVCCSLLFYLYFWNICLPILYFFSTITNKTFGSPPCKGRAYSIWSLSVRWFKQVSLKPLKHLTDMFIGTSLTDGDHSDLPLPLKGSQTLPSCLGFDPSSRSSNVPWNGQIFWSLNLQLWRL